MSECKFEFEYPIHKPAFLAATHLALTVNNFAANITKFDINRSLLTLP